MAEIREHVVRQLIATGKWGERGQAHLGERANYRCEYCDRDLLASADAYKLWQQDHIVPVEKGGNGDFENLALACSLCNKSFKGKWDPRSRAGENASRPDLVSAVRAYVHEQRRRIEDELVTLRGIVGLDRQDPGSRT